MRLSISWSGDLSRGRAEVLRGCLPALGLRQWGVRAQPRYLLRPARPRQQSQQPLPNPGFVPLAATSPPAEPPFHQGSRLLSSLPELEPQLPDMGRQMLEVGEEAGF
jgi:hypothetical protein